MQLVKTIKRKFLFIVLIFLGGEGTASDGTEDDTGGSGSSPTYVGLDNLIRDEDYRVIASYMTGPSYNIITRRTEAALVGAGYVADHSSDLYCAEFVRQLTLYVNQKETNQYEEDFVMLVYRMVVLLDSPEECVFASDASFHGLTPEIIEQGASHLIENFEEYFKAVIEEDPDISLLMACELIATHFYENFVLPDGFTLSDDKFGSLYRASYSKMLSILEVSELADDPIRELLVKLRERVEVPKESSFGGLGLSAVTLVAGCSLASLLFLKLRRPGPTGPG